MSKDSGSEVVRDTQQIEWSELVNIWAERDNREKEEIKNDSPVLA